MSVLERVDRRYLAGLLFEDATTGAPVTAPLRVSADGARFFRNASGIFVLSSATGLEAQLREFEVAPAVASVALSITIVDPSGFYLPRLLTLALPRSSDPSAANAVVRPVRVALYRSAGTGLGANWSSVDATLVDSATSAPVKNALVRVVRQSDHGLLGVGILMAGLSDAPTTSERTRGQLTVPIVGVPVVAWSSGDGAVLISSVAVLLEIVAISASLSLFDPDAFIEVQGVSLGPVDVSAGRRVNAGVLSITVPN